MRARLGREHPGFSFKRSWVLRPLLGCAWFECPVMANSVEKLTFASAEMAVPKAAQAPFLSGFARLLRCGKDLGQFPEVLSGGGEEEFVICTAWAT